MLDAVNNSDPANNTLTSSGNGSGGSLLPHKALELEQQARLYRREAEEWLFNHSPIPEAWNLTTYEVLLRRFPAETPLCFATESYEHSKIYPLRPWMENTSMPKFIVPNAWIRQTEKGHWRLKEDFRNTWWYQVTEFDRGNRDEQASKILWLRDRVKSPQLCMVLWSGGKSLHAWWDVRKLSHRRRTAFFSLARSIGADPAHETINQLARTPNTFRREKDGHTITITRQSVLYLI